MTQLRPRAAAPTFLPCNSFVITALVFALIGLVFGLIPFTQFIALTLGMLAVVFGLLGWSRARQRATNRKVTVIAAALGIAAAALGIAAAALGIWGIINLFGAIDKPGNGLQGIDRHTPAVGDIAVSIHGSG